MITYLTSCRSICIAIYAMQDSLPARAPNWGKRLVVGPLTFSPRGKLFPPFSLPPSHSHFSEEHDCRRRLLPPACRPHLQPPTQHGKQEGDQQVHTYLWCHAGRLQPGVVNAHLPPDSSGQPPPSPLPVDNLLPPSLHDGGDYVQLAEAQQEVCLRVRVALH